MQNAIPELRRRLSALEPAASRKDRDPCALGHAGIDRHLGGGLARGCLHETFARDGRDAAAATGFTLGLALRTAGEGRGLVWVRHHLAGIELGTPYAPGLAELGVDPGQLILVAARDPVGALRAAHEALRCRALGAMLIELWGEAAALDLVASRRLMLAAAQSGVTALVMRAGAAPRPSAALSRWIVAGAPSIPLAADSPGRPAFDIRLDRHRAGIPPGRWRVEWNRDEQCFTAPVPFSRAVAAVPGNRPAMPSADIGHLRRAS